MCVICIISSVVQRIVIVLVMEYVVIFEVIERLVFNFIQVFFMFFDIVNFWYLKMLRDINVILYVSKM